MDRGVSVAGGGMRWPGGMAWHLCATALSVLMTAVVAQDRLDDYEFLNYGKNCLLSYSVSSIERFLLTVHAGCFS